MFDKTNYYYRKSCRMCGGTSLTKTISLAATTRNDFLKKEELDKEEQIYPLDELL